MAECSPNKLKTLWEKGKLLVTSNYSFSHGVCKRLVLQTRKNQGLFGKGLNTYPLILIDLVQFPRLELEINKLADNPMATIKNVGAYSFKKEISLKKDRRKNLERD